MTAREVLDLIKKNQGGPWSEGGYRDTVKLGNPDTTVKGIATTMIVTLDVLQRANKAGLNMIIAHEDTWWNDRDDTKDVVNLPLYKLKTDFILKNDMVVWRMHDHMHSMKPDFTVVGELRDVGVKGGEDAVMQAGIREIPQTTLGELAADIKKRKGWRAVRCAGDPKMKVSKVLVGPGYATPRMAAGADVVVGGEQQEADLAFDNIEYVADAATAGIAKGVIMLGHWVSEESGMEDLAKRFSAFLPGIRIEYVPAGEPYWT